MSVLMTAAVDTATSFSIGDVVTDVVSVLTTLLSFITSNWLLIFLLLAPFIIGLLIALIHSLRG